MISKSLSLGISLSVVRRLKAESIARKKMEASHAEVHGVLVFFPPKIVPNGREPLVLGSSRCWVSLLLDIFV